MAKKTLLLLSFMAACFLAPLSAQNFHVYISDAAGFQNPPWKIFKFDENGANGQVFISDHLAWPQDILFLENELRLADLATYLDISRHQLSQVINEHYGVNFFELINTYRVEHVKRLLADPNFKHYTVIQIAYEAGFNNKASFNRYFKREIGMTPSAYRIKEDSASS
ncbi:MAG: helix-turn-helix domain-containing protein [Saprospiraceae bacterium]